MKTFKQFLDEAKKVKIYTDKPIGWKVEDVGANKKVVKTTKSKGWKDEKIQELFGFMEPKPQPKPDTKVLAYKNYQPGELNKTTGQFTQRSHTGSEQKRYGWKPVNVSSYSKADTPGTLTASGHKFDNKQRLVAVPYASKTSSKPSTPFGTKLQITKAPGTNTPVASTSVQDTGNFGATGNYNKQTSYDLSLLTARDVAGKPNISSQQFGKQKVYVRNAPQPTAAAKLNKK